MFGWRNTGGNGEGGMGNGFGAEGSDALGGGPGGGGAEGDPAVEMLTMLHFAASAGRTDLVREALKVGADLNGLLRVEQGGKPLTETALHAASKLGNVDVVMALLAAGADPSIQDSQGASTVECAAGAPVVTAYVMEMCQRAARGDVDGVTQILAAGLDPKIPDPARNTALHWACAYGRLEVADCLLKFGALVNVSNNKGDTPLREAERQKADVLCQLLVSQGAVAELESTGNMHPSFAQDPTPPEQQSLGSRPSPYAPHQQPPPGSFAQRRRDPYGAVAPDGAPHPDMMPANGMMMHPPTPHGLHPSKSMPTLTPQPPPSFTRGPQPGRAMGPSPPQQPPPPQHRPPPPQQSPPPSAPPQGSPSVYLDSVRAHQQQPVDPRPRTGDLTPGQEVAPLLDDDPQRPTSVPPDVGQERLQHPAADPRVEPRPGTAGASLGPPPPLPQQPMPPQTLPEMGPPRSMDLRRGSSQTRPQVPLQPQPGHPEHQQQQPLPPPPPPHMEGKTRQRYDPLHASGGEQHSPLRNSPAANGPDFHLPPGGGGAVMAVPNGVRPPGPGPPMGTLPTHAPPPSSGSGHGGGAPLNAPPPGVYPPSHFPKPGGQVDGNLGHPSMPHGNEADVIGPGPRQPNVMSSRSTPPHAMMTTETAASNGLEAAPRSGPEQRPMQRPYSQEQWQRQGMPGVGPPPPGAAELAAGMGGGPMLDRSRHYHPQGMRPPPSALEGRPPMGAPLPGQERHGGMKPPVDGYEAGRPAVEQKDGEIARERQMPQWAQMLWPRPQRFHLMSTSRDFVLPPEMTISAEPAHFSIATRLAAWLQSCDLDPNVRIIAPQNGCGHIHLSVNKELFGGRAQAYQLVVRPVEINVIGSDPAGLFYGCCTLDQLVRLVCTGGGKASLPCCAMTDWPQLTQRGVMLDISRGKVLTNSTLRQLIERLARLKFNQVQLYMEHTFGYLSHEEVWRDSGAISPEEVMNLDQFCANLFVELVPCQNSLSGFNMWLKNPRYTFLAECPDAADMAGLDTSESRGRMSLCPVDPNSIQFITDLYEQLLPCFSSSQLHVGLDRAADLGQGRSAKEVEAKGLEVVALEYLRTIAHVAQLRGKSTVQYWADFLTQKLDAPREDISDLAMLLPAGAIAMERGEEADHPFYHRCRRLASLGVPFYVCPSTCSHNSFGGRVSTCLENIRNAAMAAVDHAAVGMLVTDFGYNGHLQPLAASYPGFIAGAGAAWNARDSLSADEYGLRHLAALLDAHIFVDWEETAAVGTILTTVGDLHLVAEGWDNNDVVNGGAAGPEPLFGASRLFQLLVYEGELASLEGLTPFGLERAENRVFRSLELLDTYQGMAGRIDVEEVRLILELLRLCIRIGLCIMMSKGPDAQEFKLEWLPEMHRSELAAALIRCLDMHKYVWTKRNKREGFTRSRNWLDRALTNLVTGLPQLEQTAKERREFEWKI